MDELKAPWALFRPGGGLKTDLAPLFFSCGRITKMPALAPNAEKLCVANIMLVTQYKATSDKHLKAVKELKRVLNISEQDNDRGEVAREFFVRFAWLVTQSVILVTDVFEVEINAANPWLIGLFYRSLTPRQICWV